MNFAAKATKTPSPTAAFCAGRMGVLFLLVLLMLPAGSWSDDQSKKKAAPSATATTDLVWPAPPQRPRVRYVGQFASFDDVVGKKQKRSWMDRIAGVKGEEPTSRLQKPYGIAVDSRDRIYVADAGNRIVFVFDLNAKRVEFRGDRPPAKLALPIGVAVDDKDRLFVADSFNHQITCFDPDGNVLAMFGDDKLQRTGGIAIDKQRGRLYVADAKAHRIAVFDTGTFAFVRYVGERSMPGEAETGKLSAPSNVAVDAFGLLYVADTWNYRIQVFDPDGNYVRAFGEQGVLPGNFIRPKGLAFDSEGHLYVADAEFNNFQILTPQGQPLLAIGGYGGKAGQFVLIAGLAVDKNNRIYTTEQWKPRVQIFEYLPETKPAEKGGKK